MPQVVGVDTLYAGTESWAIQDTATELQKYTNDFKSQNTRTNVLNRNDYSDGLGGKLNVTVFSSKDTIKALAKGNAGNTLRTNVLGVALLFGYDATAQRIVLIARSANSRAVRPFGSDFTNFNYKSKEAGDTNTNASLLDSEVDTLTAAFRNQGYTHLTGLAEGATRSIAFDNQILARLIYSDPNLNIAGQTTMHLVAAPAYKDEQTGVFLFLDAQGNPIPYLSIVEEGKNAQNATIYRGNPPCPPQCYQNV